MNNDCVLEDEEQEDYHSVVESVCVIEDDIRPPRLNQNLDADELRVNEVLET